MAKATVKEIRRKPRKVYKLTLSEREAEAIATVIACTVTGSSHSPRTSALAVLGALRTAGLDYVESEAYALIDRSEPFGTINFLNY